MTGLKSKDRGFALIAVVWLTSIIAIICVTIIQLTRTTAAINRADELSVQANAAFSGALVTAIDQLNSSKPKLDELPISFDLVVGDVSVSITVKDESNKLDINTAPQDLLETFFEFFSSSQTEAREISAAIIDWRDMNIVPEYFGAEATEYQASGSNVLPRNAPFTSIGEMKFLRGMTSELFDCISPYVSVHAHSVNVDVSKLVDGKVEEQTQITARPTSVLFQNQALTGRALLIEMTATIEKYQTAKRAIVRLTGAVNDPFWLLVWSDYTETSNTCESVS